MQLCRNIQLALLQRSSVYWILVVTLPQRLTKSNSVLSQFFNNIGQLLSKKQKKKLGLYIPKAMHCLPGKKKEQ